MNFSHKEWALLLFFCQISEIKKVWFLYLVCITEKVIVQAVFIKKQKTNNNLNQKRTPESALDGCSPPTLKASSINCFSKWTTSKWLREHKSQLEYEGWVWTVKKTKTGVSGIYIGEADRCMCIAPDFSSKQVQLQTNWTEVLHF